MGAKLSEFRLGIFHFGRLAVHWSLACFYLLYVRIFIYRARKRNDIFNVQVIEQRAHFDSLELAATR